MGCLPRDDTIKTTTHCGTLKNCAVRSIKNKMRGLLCKVKLKRVHIVLKLYENQIFYLN